MSKQCTKPKRKRDEAWLKDKVLLVQAQANGQILYEDELEFLAGPGIAEAQTTHAQSQRGKEMRRGLRIRCSWFKLKQMDKFFMGGIGIFGRSRDSRYSKHIIALMANLSHYGSDNLAEVHNPDNVIHNVIDQDS
nr:hypothetical protein [Tanacetum cinerariifolium]